MRKKTNDKTHLSHLSVKFFPSFVICNTLWVCPSQIRSSQLFNPLVDLVVLGFPLLLFVAIDTWFVGAVFHYPPPEPILPFLEQFFNLPITRCLAAPEIVVVSLRILQIWLLWPLPLRVQIRIPCNLFIFLC